MDNCSKKHIPEMGRGFVTCDCGDEVRVEPVEGCYKLHETPWLEEYPDNIPTDIKTADLSLLVEGAELDLIRDLSRLPEEIRLAAVQRDPSRLNRYATQVATAFHKFYTECRIKDAAPALREARILLSCCTAAVIENALSCFGVSAPDHM